MNSASTASPPDARALTPIALSTLRAGEPLEFDLYIRIKSEPARLFLAKQHRLEQRDVDRLVENGQEALFILSTASEEYCGYLREHVIMDEMRQPVERLQILRQATAAVFNESFSSGKIDLIVGTVNGYGQELTELVYESELLLVDLVGVMAHDYCNFTHASNVATYCILMAKTLGHDKAQVTEIARGALLHDVGKRFIRSGVFQKRAPLTAAERDLIKEHPRRGFESLCHREDISWGQLAMVYQHHERCDGGGYPVGLVANEIHPWAKMCAVADVFDALTRDRPYRDAVAEADVLQYLDREAGRGFDEELVRCWIQAIEQKR